MPLSVATLGLLFLALLTAVFVVKDFKNSPNRNNLIVSVRSHNNSTLHYITQEQNNKNEGDAFCGYHHFSFRPQSTAKNHTFLPQHFASTSTHAPFMTTSDESSCEACVTAIRSSLLDSADPARA